MISQKAKFQTIWSFEDKDTHIAKFLSTELPLLLIIVIRVHAQEALPDMHWLSALSTTNGETTGITDIEEMGRPIPSNDSCYE